MMNSEPEPSASRESIDFKVDASTLLPTYDIRDLLGGSEEIGLLLDGTLYRLRITRQGKLILTK